MTNIKNYKRGELAKLAGVGFEALRFYEKQGLIAAPPRQSSGYRTYPHETLERILFIKRAKEIGFTLKEIKELLDLNANKAQSCCEVLDITENKIDDIESKIKDLKKLKKALSKLATTCRSNKATSECPILDHLSGDFR